MILLNPIERREHQPHLKTAMLTPLLCCASLLSCSLQQEQSITKTVSTMERAWKDPTQAVSICQKIIKREDQDHCLILAAEQVVQTNVGQTEIICSAISSVPSRSECYFRLAEYAQDISFCRQAGSFEQDCKLHLFSRELFRKKVNTYTDIELVAAQFQLSPTSIEGQTVIYRQLLSQETPIPIHRCESFPEPNACQRAAQGLYLDRLRFAASHNRFPCRDLNELDHSNHPVLLHEYQELAIIECP